MKHTFSTWNRNPLLGRHPFLVEQNMVRLSKSSRRMAKLLKRQIRTLARIKKLEERNRHKKQNMEIRAQVKTLKAQKRKERLVSPRVRERNEMGWLYFPRTSFTYSNGKTSLGTQYTGLWGTKKWIVDYSPTLRLAPPRNRTSIKSVRINSTSASIQVRPVQRTYPTMDVPSCKWGLDGLYAYPMSMDISTAVDFDETEANKALQKAFAKVNSADIQMNEYLFEWKQVLRLLKDPMRTALSLSRRLKRWVDKDAWVYIPGRTYRKFGKGVLVSKLPTGGVLMSMRTKRVLDPLGVSDQFLQAAANRWLQYRYGIAPLVNDITIAMSWYERNFIAQRRWKRTASARHHITRTKQRTEYTVKRQDFHALYEVTKLTGKHYSAKVWFNIKYDPPLSFKLGIHPSQWLVAFWNALPYSFVADWVVNIDDWLTASLNPPWIELGPNVVTVKDYEKVVARCKKVTPNYGLYGAMPTEVKPGLPIAIKIREAMRREIDLPKVTEPVLSNRWQTIKNAATALALVYKPYQNSIKRR